MSRINLIKEKIEILKEKDKRFSIFGSNNHKYKINASLSKDELARIELENKIILSEEYKEFVQQIGNGGAGCGNGLLSLTLANINPPFIGSEELLRNCEDPEELEVDMVDIDEISGYVKLFDHGGGMETCLIVRGKEVGELIFFDCEGAFRKLSTNSFFDIYEKWLDESIEILERVEKLLIENQISDVIDKEWERKNYFIREMIYSILDVHAPKHRLDSIEYETEMEKKRLSWLENL